MYFYKDCSIFTKPQMEEMKTRQLLNHLRSVYRWGEYDWTREDYIEKDKYITLIKSVLATREHIPNKQESKQIRKAKIKKGD